MRVLGQLARALEAIHAVEGVHRDVKGDNVLVRAEDGTAVLMDFGSGYFRGAPILTWQPPPPGTSQYWSPECLRFQWKWLRHPRARYEARPADDVYALGVMAYRLVTGVYPPPGVDFVETEEGTQLVEPAPVPVETRVALHPELAALITRMLSAEPSARGSATELAEALERASDAVGPQADQPITPVSAQTPTVSTPPVLAPAPTVSESPASEQAPTESTPRVAPLHPGLEWSQWLAVAAGVLLVLGVWWAAHEFSGSQLAVVSETEQSASKQDAGVVGLGDEVPGAPVSTASSKPARSGMGVDMVKKPFPGQHRPPCQKSEVEINGGCWVRISNATPPCGARHFDWDKGCYLPVFELPQPPTSGEP
jgi:serine/threonine protein kinase